MQRKAVASVLLLLQLVHGCQGSAGHYDLDRDGKVAVDELVAVAYAEQGLSKDEMGEVVSAADADRDGVMGEAELQQAERSLHNIADQRAKQWIKTNDANHDGFISEDEFRVTVSRRVGVRRKDVQDMFRMADKKRDGRLSVHEAAVALILLRTKILIEANNVLEKYDSDKNGKISEHEAILLADVVFDVGTEDALDAFERMARNDEEIGRALVDGFLESLRETAIEQAPEKMKEVDEDGDGFVNLEELRSKYKKKKSSLMKKVFKKVDINRDAKLEAAEWVTLTTEMSRLKKKKSARKEKVIHIHPTAQYEGAARDEEKRSKRETKKDKEEVEAEEIMLKEWNGILPEDLIPMDETATKQSIVIPSALKDPLQDFKTLDVLDDDYIPKLSL